MLWVSGTVKKFVIFDVSYLMRYLLCILGSKWGSKGGSSYMHLADSILFFLARSLGWQVANYPAQL